MQRSFILWCVVVGVILILLWSVDRRNAPQATPLSSEQDPFDPSARSLELGAIGSAERSTPVEHDAIEVVSAQLEDIVLPTSSSAATFHVAGNLGAPAGLNDQERLVLRIRESIGAGWKDVARVDVAPGEWGPVDVPVGNSPWFLARLEGRYVIPEERVFAAPAAEGWIILSFEARMGVSQWYLTTDIEENPLAGATVEVAWRYGNRWVRQEGITEENGYTKISGIEPGPVVAHAWREGYVPVRAIELILPPPEPTTYPLQMARAGSVRGRVTFRGEPVSDFSVGFWDSRRGEAFTDHREFTGREDGSFALAEVPPGSVFLVASSAESPGSAPISITVPTEDEEPVELALLEGRRGTGIVVDAESGQPLAEATIQCFVRGAQSAVLRWGPPLPVRSDGSFEVGGVLPGGNLIEVSAPGYATRPVSVDCVDGDPVSFGTVRLPRSRELVVRLLGAAPDACSGYQLSAKGTAPIAAHGFEASADGDAVAVLPDVSPGYYHLSLRRPDSSNEGFDVDLGQEGSWEQAFRASGGGDLKVELAGDAQRARFVSFSFRGGGGLLHERRAWILPGKDLTFAHVEPGPVEVEILDDLGRVIGRRQAAVSEGVLTTVEFTLTNAQAVLTVVGKDGKGLPGVWVRLRPAGDATRSWTIKTTDADGRAELGAVAPGAYLAHLTHGEHGMRLNVPVAVSAEDEEIELELVASGALDLQFLDGDVPVPSTTFHLADQDGIELTGVPYHADDTGRVVLDRIAPCTLRLSLFDERLWHVEPEVQVAAGVTPHVIQVRRLGDLRVEVRNTDGVPVSGMAVELRSTELQASVGDWIASGRVQSSSAEGETDNQGRLTLRGLPNGEYAWRLVLLDGTELIGSVQVKAEAETRSLLVVP